MSKIAIFASGTGTNAEQIISFLKEKESPLEVSVIVTNKKEAGIYSIAKKNNVTIEYFSNTEFSSAEKVIDYLKEKRISWIILAGFLRKIEPKIINRFNNRIINLHPSLLPKFGGKGMYGDHVHKAVIEAGEKESGISIHLVNNEFDKGRVIFQAVCLVEKGQTVEQLKENIQNLEHRHFPEVIEDWIRKNS